MIPTMPPTEDDIAVLERQRYDARRAMGRAQATRPLGRGPTQAELGRMVAAIERDRPAPTKLARGVLLEAFDSDPRTWTVQEQVAHRIEYTRSGLVRGTSYGCDLGYLE